MISFGSKPRRSPLEYVQILTGYEDYFPEFFILDSWRVASVSTPQKPHRGCPRSLALGDRGDSGPQLARRSPRSSRIGPGKRRSGPKSNQFQSGWPLWSSATIAFCVDLPPAGPHWKIGEQRARPWDNLSAMCPVRTPPGPLGAVFRPLRHL
jgi:hypothetical protein